MGIYLPMLGHSEFSSKSKSPLIYSKKNTHGNQKDPSGFAFNKETLKNKKRHVGVIPKSEIIQDGVTKKFETFMGSLLSEEVSRVTKEHPRFQFSNSDLMQIFDDSVYAISKVINNASPRLSIQEIKHITETFMMSFLKFQSQFKTHRHDHDTIDFFSRLFEQTETTTTAFPLKPSTLFKLNVLGSQAAIEKFIEAAEAICLFTDSFPAGTVVETPQPRAITPVRADSPQTQAPGPNRALSPATSGNQKRIDPTSLQNTDGSFDIIDTYAKPYFDSHPGENILPKDYFRTNNGNTLPWSILKTDEGDFIALLNADMDLNKGTKISSGSFGKVVTGYNFSTGQKLAIKKLYTNGTEKKEKDGKTIHYKGEQENKLSFKEEYQIMVEIARKTNTVESECIIQPYGHAFVPDKPGSASGKTYIVMDLAEENVANAILSQTLSFSKKIDYLRQLGEAIQKLHNNKFVHRDIRLVNGLIKNDKIVLGDFGRAASFAKIKENIKPQELIVKHPYTGEVIRSRSEYSAIIRGDLNAYINSIRTSLKLMKRMGQIPKEMKPIVEAFLDDIRTISNQHNQSVQMIVDHPFWGQIKAWQPN